MHKHFDFEYIFSQVFVTYGKVFAIFMAYYFSKTYVSMYKNSMPSRLEKAIRYSGAGFWTGIISMFVVYAYSRSLNSNAVIITYALLVLPALLGVADGF